jgi:histidyl-tRNA synthetase
MYVLKTKGGSLLALRPENTAGIARAYIEHHLSRMSQPQKLYYEGPFFRHDNPQAGRFRQFHQVGFEILGGTNDPIYDAQVILIAQRLLEELKIKNINLKINSIGCKVCRPLYKRQLQNYYKNHEKGLCPDCTRRFKTNILRLLDCKKESCGELKSGAPNILDKLCVSCSNHLKAVLEYLDELSISYNLDNQLVRGLDYYNRTVFEFFVEGPGAEAGALPAGGRYDYLIEMLGGRLTPAVGFACGIERLIYAMKAQQVKLPARLQKKVFLIHVGELAKKKSFSLIERLRAAGILVKEALGRQSLKAQLKAADREGADLALILGQKEIFEDNIIIRDLKNSLQEIVPLSKIVEEIKKRLKS